MIRVPATPENARKIFRLATKYNLNIDENLEELFKVNAGPTKLEGFNYTLKNFQAEGVAWLESHLGTGLLADEQGTGKTVQVMAYAHKNKKFPMLIVCPNTLKLNWKKEILAMTGQQYTINVVGAALSSKQKAQKSQLEPNVTYSKSITFGQDIYIINYDILAKNLNDILKIDCELMALDESHKIKSHTSNRTEAFDQLATGRVDYKLVSKPIPCVILMSGTPMVNKPVELYTSVNAIAGYVPEFSNFSKFTARFCDIKFVNGYKTFSGCSNEAELNHLLKRHVMLRRLKKDVLAELPPKVYHTVPLDFDRKDYDKVELAFSGLNWEEGVKTMIKFGGNAPQYSSEITAIQKLREIAAHSKIQSAVEWIKDYVENNNKLVVFAHNVGIIDTIARKLVQSSIDVRTIKGGMDLQDRESSIHDFQTDANVKVIVVGISVGSAGLTLTAADAVAFVQLPWSPGEISQCADRVHRIGQDSTSVSIYNLVAENTIEERIAEMIFRKGTMLDKVLDDGQVVNAINLIE